MGRRWEPPSAVVARARPCLPHRLPRAMAHAVCRAAGAAGAAAGRLRHGLRCQQFRMPSCHFMYCASPLVLCPHGSAVARAQCCPVLYVVCSRRGAAPAMPAAAQGGSWVESPAAASAGCGWGGRALSQLCQRLPRPCSCGLGRARLDQAGLDAASVCACPWLLRLCLAVCGHDLACTRATHTARHLTCTE